MGGARRTSLRGFSLAGFIALCLGLVLGCAPAAKAGPEPGSEGPPTIYDVEIVKAYPHDAQAFTQGLYYKNGYLYESTGLKGRSTVRKVEIETGKVLQRKDLPETLFGEGVTDWRGEIIGLTWRSQVGFVYDEKSFDTKRRFTYPGEGWGVTTDGDRLIMSDGTSSLRFLNPRTLKETGRIAVTLKGKPLANLNELEWVDGEIYANVWLTDAIVRIDPQSGRVVGVIDLSSLHKALGADAQAIDVLNGVAYDAKDKRLFVTGKLWPKLFEIKLVPKETPAN